MPRKAEAGVARYIDVGEIVVHQRPEQDEAAYGHQGGDHEMGFFHPRQYQGAALPYLHDGHKAEADGKHE
jgi:hypothetical protein